MKFNEKLLKDNGIKLILDTDPTIFGTIKYVDDLYLINYWYKNVYQNEFHEDSMSDARIKLKSLLINAYKQSKLDENILSFKEWENLKK